MDTSDALLWSGKVFDDEDEGDFTPEFKRGAAAIPDDAHRFYEHPTGLKSPLRCENVIGGGASFSSTL